MRWYILLTLGLIISIPGITQTIDKKASKETVALFKNLKELSKNHTLFGHQHATEYGHGWYGHKNRFGLRHKERKTGCFYGNRAGVDPQQNLVD